MTLDIDHTLPPVDSLTPDVERKASLTAADLCRRAGGSKAELADFLGALGLIPVEASKRAVQRLAPVEIGLDLSLPPFPGCRPCAKQLHWLTEENTALREKADRVNPSRACRACRRTYDRARKRERGGA